MNLSKLSLTTKALVAVLAVLAVLLLVFLARKYWRSLFPYSGTAKDSAGWSPAPYALELKNAMDGVNDPDGEVRQVALNKLMGMNDAQFLAVCKEFQRLTGDTLRVWINDEYWFFRTEAKNAVLARMNQLQVP